MVPMPICSQNDRRFFAIVKLSRSGQRPLGLKILPVSTMAKSIGCVSYRKRRRRPLNLIVANTTGVMFTLNLRAHPELGSGLAHRASHKSFYIYGFVNLSYVLAMLLGFVAPTVSYGNFVIVLMV